MKKIKASFRKLDISSPSDVTEGKAPNQLALAEKRILSVPGPIPQNFPKFDTDDSKRMVR